MSHMKLKLLVAGLALGCGINTVQAGQAFMANSVSQTSYYLVAVNAQGQKAQDFIGNMGDKAVAFLSNNSLSKAQKQKEFRKLLQSSFDMNMIARFAMGRYWRTASKAQQTEYLNLFENMIVDVYSSRFGEYKGEKFNIVGSRADGKSDILVNSHIIPNNGSKVKVDWRVREKNGQMKIIDVIIEGVSMSLTQRSDFSSVIQRGGGDVEVLLKHLRKK